MYLKGELIHTADRSTSHQDIIVARFADCRYVAIKTD